MRIVEHVFAGIGVLATLYALGILYICAFGGDQ